MGFHVFGNIEVPIAGEDNGFQAGASRFLAEIEDVVSRVISTRSAIQRLGECSVSRLRSLDQSIW